MSAEQPKEPYEEKPATPEPPEPRVIYREIEPKPFKRRMRRVQDYMLWVIMFMLLGLVIAGSAGLIDFPPQTHAGITKIEVELTDTGTIKRLQATDGKERSLMQYTITTGDTEINVSGKDITAFAGQLTRSDVEKLLAEKGVKDPSSKTIDAIMLLLKAL